MVRLLLQTHNKDGYSTNNSPPFSPNSLSPYSNGVEEMTNPSKSPLLIVISIAIFVFVFFLIVYFVTKLYCNSSPQLFTIEALHGQLQEVFNPQDSRQNQAFIDRLSIFQYKDIAGRLKDTKLYDCSSCLYAFSKTDMLRLLPYLALKLTSVESNSVKTVNVTVTLFYG